MRDGFLTSTARDENLTGKELGMSWVFVHPRSWQIVSKMVYGLMADLVVVSHALFVLFVAAGGLLVLVKGKTALVHVPCVLWAVAVEWAGWICPLTPLENELRSLAGRQAYGGDFVGHYLIPILYPETLTRGLQMALGAGVLVLNGFFYWVALRRTRRSRRVWE